MEEIAQQGKQAQVESFIQLSSTVTVLVVNQPSRCFHLQVLLKRKEKPHIRTVKKSVMGLMLMEIVLAHKGITFGHQLIGVFIEAALSLMGDPRYKPDGLQFHLGAIGLQPRTVGFLA
jgi:hypothetical protein